MLSLEWILSLGFMALYLFLVFCFLGLVYWSLSLQHRASQEGNTFFVAEEAQYKLLVFFFNDTLKSAMVKPIAKLKKSKGSAVKEAEQRWQPVFLSYPRLQKVVRKSTGLSIKKSQILVDLLRIHFQKKGHLAALKDILSAADSSVNLDAVVLAEGLPAVNFGLPSSEDEDNGRKEMKLPSRKPRLEGPRVFRVDLKD